MTKEPSTRFKIIAYLTNQHGAYARLWGRGEEMVLERGRWSKYHSNEQVTSRYVGPEVWEHWTEITQEQYNDLWGNSLYESMKD